MVRQAERERTIMKEEVGYPHNSLEAGDTAHSVTWGSAKPRRRCRETEIAGKNLYYDFCGKEWMAKTG